MQKKKTAKRAKTAWTKRKDIKDASSANAPPKLCNSNKKKIKHTKNDEQKEDI